MPLVCSSCNVGLRPSLNGVTVVETAHDPPQIYKIWMADEWSCPSCGHAVITGFSDRAKHVVSPESRAEALERARDAQAEGKLRIWLERLGQEFTLA
jgi:PHP family Zn ribbon phosphoesterase